MYATDQIYQASMWALDEEAKRAEAEAERWAWHAEHLPHCTKTDVAITVIDDATFTEPCCPACWVKIWKPEGATLLHQLHVEPVKVAA